MEQKGQTHPEFPHHKVSAACQRLTFVLVPNEPFPLALGSGPWLCPTHQESHKAKHQAPCPGRPLDAIPGEIAAAQSTVQHPPMERKRKSTYLFQMLLRAPGAQGCAGVWVGSPAEHMWTQGEWCVRVKNVASSLGE